jgi:hypothetical protein
MATSASSTRGEGRMVTVVMGPAGALRKYFAKRPHEHRPGPWLFLQGNARFYVSPES